MGTSGRTGRNDMGRFDAEGFAVKIHNAASQRTPHDLRDLALLLGRPVVGEAVSVLDDILMTRTEAEHEPTTGDFVDRGSPHRDDPGAAHEYGQDSCPQPYF